MKSLCFTAAIVFAGTAVAQTGGAMVGTAPGKAGAVQKGDQVEPKLTQALAIAVEPAAKN